MPSPDCLLALLLKLTGALSLKAAFDRGLEDIAGVPKTADLGFEAARDWGLPAVPLGVFRSLGRGAAGFTY